MSAYFSDKRDKTIIATDVGCYADKTLVDEVYLVQLTGEELDYGLSIIGRESVPKRVFTFVGDDAKMILMNW